MNLGYKILLIIIIVFFNTSVIAASTNEIQARYDKLSIQFNKMRGLALSILKDIKQIDEECRNSDGEPIINKIVTARSKLNRVKLLRVSFNTSYKDVEILLAQLTGDLKNLADDNPINIKLKPILIKMSSDMVKYHNYVDRYYRKTVSDFGEPEISSAPITSVSNDKKLLISGEVTAGLGNSKYERISINPVYKASSTDISFGLKGKYIPNAKTNLLAYVDHKSTVERREIGLTKMGASVVQQFTSDLSASAGLDIDKYSDKENDVANFSDFGMFARMNYQKNDKRFDVNIKRVKRSYPNADETEFILIPDNPPRADIYKPEYTTTSFRTRAILPSGQGQIKLQLKYFKKTVGNKFFDFTELNPSMVWTISPSGSELGASYQKFTHPNQDSSITDNNRIKVHYYKASRDSKSSKKWGPEIAMYRYPQAEEKNYTDIKLISQTNSRGKRFSSTQWEIVYRLYSDSTQFDFAQLQYHKNSRPVSSGMYSSFNIAARYYTEASDKDNELRFGNVHPAHTLDFYWDFGWSKPGASWMRRLMIGPIVGTRMFFDTEREDAFDADFVDIDFVLMNPRNSARFGVKVGISGVSNTGVTWQADVSYIRSILYNADPVRSTSILELNTKINYPINNRWLVEGYSKVHNTRAEIASPADLNKLDIGIRARYLFDLAQ